jgi:RHS repeat-associated protein
VTSLSTGESYTYDANGNTLAPGASAGVITRVEGGLTYTQVFDVENRLISVTVNGQTTQFIYDSDGNLVKKIKPDGSKTLYVGGIYEVDKDSAGTVTGTKTYYPVAGAMRINSTLYYVLKDHLGSASVVTDANGVTLSSGGEQRYSPYGGERLTPGISTTDKLFTGQRDTGLGIYHYGARFYSPYINRFLSADTVVPGYANPQNLNRYGYVLNNPLRFTDPSGHRPDDGCRTGEGCSLSLKQKDDDAQKLAKLKRESETRKCWSGDKKHCSGFDNAFIALDKLDLGDGTIQFGLGTNGFTSAVGIKGDIGVAIDFKGNVAIIGTGGGGGYIGVGGGVGAYLTVTNAPSVPYLQGPNVQIGGQIGEGETVGAEYVMFKGEGRDQYRGLTISDKAHFQVPWPFEAHTTATGSKILIQRNIPDIIVDLFRP